MNLERLYLDYNATSPLSPSVLNWLRDGDYIFANPSSQHFDGKHSRKCVNDDRALIYKAFNKSEKDTKLFFHSGATEAFHTFATSFSEIARLSGKELLICYSKIDHPAVTSLAERYFGSHVKFFELKRDKNLRYSWSTNLEALKDKKDNNPDLIILYHHLWVHNETGHVSELNELDQLILIPDLYVHIDAVQAPGKIINWQFLDYGHIWSFSAHKFGALKGIGFSFFRNDVPFHPLITGGGQQGNLRSGTENVQGIRSISLAISDLLKVNVAEMMKKRQRLVEIIYDELKEVGSIVQDGLMASNTIYFYLNRYPSDITLALFDLNGIQISSGSACSSGAAKPSAVLLQMGLQAVGKNGLRLSMPFEVEDEFIDKLENRLHKIFIKLDRGT